MTEKGLSLRLISRNGVHITLKTCTSGVIKRAPNPKNSTIISGEVSEWLKEHAWKVCIGQKPIGGSNPPLSAKPNQSPAVSGIFYLHRMPKLASGHELQIKNRPGRGGFGWVCSLLPRDHGRSNAKAVIPCNGVHSRHSLQSKTDPEGAALVGFDDSPSGITAEATRRPSSPAMASIQGIRCNP